jgi:group 4 capsule polysaccharide lipoprotein GfcB/YjbF
MMRPGLRLRVVFGLVLILGLAACSGGDGEPSRNMQIIEASRALLSKRFDSTPPPVVTRAVLDTLDGSFMEAVLERNGQLAYLFVSTRRRDDRPGEIVVWRTEDNITLALRSGVLIATRGMGGDLLSSDVAIREAQAGPAGSGARRQQVRALDNKALTLSLACEVTDMGPETIEIVGARHATRRIVENCEGAGGSIVNEYWIDSRRNLVWQSRQWVSPEVGYLRLRRLTAG